MILNKGKKKCKIDSTSVGPKFELPKTIIQCGQLGVSEASLSV